MKPLLKVTPLAFLAILCLIPLVNAATLAPTLGAPSYLQRSPSLLRTVGPPPTWSETYGGTENEYMYGMAQCSDGGFALVGYTYSFGVDNADVYLVRTDADGNMLWNKTYGYADFDYGYDVAALSDGFVIAARSNSFTASYDLWLIRTDLSGNLVWNISYGGSESEYVRGIIACAGGGFATIGYTSSFGAGSYDVWLVHTNATGGDLWNTTYGGTGADYGYDLLQMSDGGFVIIGHTYTFGEGGADAWMIRTDASGNHLWNQTYGDTSSDYAYSIIECSSGGFAFAGRTYNYGATSGAAWLVKTDASGNHQWNQTYDAEYYDCTYDLLEYSEGGFALAGEVDQEPIRDGYADGFLLRTDANGNMLWNHSYAISMRSLRYRNIVEGSAGELYTAGYGDFGTGTSNDAWLVKYRNVLYWNPAPTDQTLLYGVPLAYDLNVSSYFGTATWTINDTTNFAISAAGIVTNALVLPVGNYGLSVSVTDTAGCEITGEFTVIILPTLISPIPLELIILIAAIIIIIIILLLLCYYLLRKRK